MAWSAPRTWVTAEVVTASIMNTDVRDNFLETGPAVATTGDRYIVTDGANSIVERATGTALVSTTETTTSTSYTDLATSGPSVTVTTGTRAFVAFGARMFNSSVGVVSFMSYDVSGASAISANDAVSTHLESDPAAQVAAQYYGGIQTALTAGSNVFKSEYKASGGTASFQNRRLSILPA